MPREWTGRAEVVLVDEYGAAVEVCRSQDELIRYFFSTGMRAGAAHLMALTLWGRVESERSKANPPYSTRIFWKLVCAPDVY